MIIRLDLVFDFEVTVVAIFVFIITVTIATWAHLNHSSCLFLFLGSYSDDLLVSKRLENLIGVDFAEIYSFIFILFLKFFF